MSELASDAAPANERPSPVIFVVGTLVIAALAYASHALEARVPVALAGGQWASLAKAIEYPVYAIAVGLVGNAALGALGARDRLAAAFRTELFIKTGLVLLGASIDVLAIARAAGPAIGQALLLVSSVFLFAFWLGGRLGLDARLRALLASAVSVCGVSAAIAAAGAVQAEREQLAYTATLVILFALPSIFLLPWLAGVLHLSPAIAGAWIGGNIDTTAAVSAAGAIVGEEALQIAAIVKATRNVLMGFVAIALTTYFTIYVEKTAPSGASKLGVIWERFPKFVLGFVAASAIASVFREAHGADARAPLAAVQSLRTWFLTAAFVSIGLELRLQSLRDAGARPVIVFGAAAVVNLAVGLLLASIFFAGFSIGG